MTSPAVQPAPQLKLMTPAFAFVLLVTGMIYSLGLPGDFVFDDIDSIVKNDAIKLDSLHPDDWARAVWSSNSGPLKRPLSMFTLALNHYVFGADVLGYKIVNILIHLGAGWLVFLLFQLLMHSGVVVGRLGNLPAMNWTLATVPASIWLLHPLQLTSVLYVVQRMAALSAFFIILGLVIWLWLRMRQIHGLSNGRRWLLVPGCLLLAAFSKENGLLLVPLIMLFESLWLRYRAPSETSSRMLRAGVWLMLVAGLCLVTIVLMWSPDLVTGGYGKRDFTLTERALSQFRILWMYIAQIFWPMQSGMSLYHDDFRLSASILQPVSTLIALLAWGAAVFLALCYRNRLPLFSLGVLFFLIGHAMESTILPLEPVYEHRNYLPTAGITMIVQQLLLLAWQCGIKARLASTTLLAMFLITCVAQTGARAADWSDLYRYYMSEVRNNPDSPRANHNAGRAIYGELKTGANEDNVRFQQAVKYFNQAEQLQPGFCFGHYSKILVASELGYDLNREWYQELRDCLATGVTDGKRNELVYSLIQCRVRGICQTDISYLNDILEVQMQQTRLPRIQAGVIRMRALVAYSLEQNDEKALKLLEQAQALRPDDPELMINRLEMLVVMGRSQEARDLYLDIRKLDRSGRYRKQLEKISRRLERDST